MKRLLGGILALVMGLACVAAVAEDVQAAVDSLPEPDRLIIRRCDLQGEQKLQVAQALGVPPHVLASRRRRGMQRLRRHLWAYEPNYWRHKGVAAFHTTWSSVVEDEVIRREESVW